MSVQSVVVAINELKEDPAVNKSIKERLNNIISHLKKDPELGKDKALVEIEEIMSGNNIEPDIRTQVWNIISMIETL